MDFKDQLHQIRMEKHKKYLEYVSNTEKDTGNTDINSVNIFNEPNPQLVESAVKIQRFMRRYYFEPKCMNDDELSNIPPIYRLRIFITNHHRNDYTEDIVDKDYLDMHRIVQRIFNCNQPKCVLFRYCFDIRKIYHIRNEAIKIEGESYYFQPDDHIKIESLWKKVNGETSSSIIYLNTLEYIKSLSIDRCEEFKLEQSVLSKSGDQFIDDKCIDDICRKYIDIDYL